MVSGTGRRRASRSKKGTAIKGLLVCISLRRLASSNGPARRRRVLGSRRAIAAVLGEGRASTCGVRSQSRQVLTTSTKGSRITYCGRSRRLS